jgi:peptidoglycan/LPS O-acetylase OafA/YrhL
MNQDKSGGFHSLEQRGRIKEIDLLRFVAAISVVLYHYGSRGRAGNLTNLHLTEMDWLFKYGFLGVHLFFMISGFVILMSVRGSDLRSFLASRASRLYPAFWFCCSATYLFLVLAGGDRVPGSAQYLANMTMFGGFFNVAPVDGVYWSLFVEMRFYLLVAIALLFRKWIDFQLFVLGWLLVTCAYDLAGLSRLRNVFLIDYAPFFIAGSAFYLIWERGASLKLVVIVAGAWLLTMGRAQAIAAEYEQLLQSSLSPLIVGVVLSLAYLSMGAIALRKTGPLAAKDWAVLGGMTYPLYLLHQNMGYRIFDMALPFVNRWVLMVLVVMLMMILARLVNVHVERRWAQPLRAWLSGSRQA